MTKMITNVVLVFLRIVYAWDTVLTTNLEYSIQLQDF